MAEMTLVEALQILGLEPGTPMDEVRAHYRRQVRATHPDLVGGDRDGVDANRRTARVTAAFATVRSAVRATDGATVPHPALVDTSPPPPSAGPDQRRRAPWPIDAVDAETVDSDTIAISAPAVEAFALLLEAAAAIGSIGYVDRQLGILEILVRFEGGPTCSLLVTLQGRAHATEAFCTMDSIEAAPTPPLRPVVEALVAALTRPR